MRYVTDTTVKIESEGNLTLFKRIFAQVDLSMVNSIRLLLGRMLFLLSNQCDFDVFCSALIIVCFS